MHILKLWLDTYLLVYFVRFITFGYIPILEQGNLMNFNFNVFSINCFNLIILTNKLMVLSQPFNTYMTPLKY